MSAMLREQLPLVECALVDAGVDWITVTQFPRFGDEVLTDVAEPMLASERSIGGYIRPWSSYGYEGFHCGRVDVGVRHDGQIVRLSGERARVDWRKVYRVASGCSRIDLQMTFRILSGGHKEIRKHHRSARRHRPKAGKPAVVTLVSGTDGACTLYLGKRSSNKMGRIYDKFAESGLDHYRHCVRFEVEFKGRMAKAIAFNLFRQVNDAEVCSVVLPGFFRMRGVTSRCFGEVSYPEITALEPFPSEYVTDVRKSLRWLDVSVRPTVQRLIEYGHYEEALAALGLRGPTPTNLVITKGG